MADPQQPVDQQVTKTPSSTENTQQMTSKTPTTRQKNPKRVAAGKATAERTKIARAAQRKALIEAQSIIANNQAKPPADPVADTPPAPVADTPSAAPETTKNVLTTTQWLSIISIIVSLVGVYYKREEIKNVFVQKTRPIATIACFATSASTIACIAASASRENQTDGLNILFVFIMNLVQASLKAAAVSGIFYDVGQTVNRGS